MYCTGDQLIDRFGEDELITLTDVDGDERPNAAVMELALQDASDEIDIYISTRASLPIASGSTPPILIRLCADIARYRLHDENPIDEVKARYDSAVKTLKDISAGRANLPLPDPASSTSTTVYGERTDSDRVFTDESLKGF